MVDHIWTWLYMYWQSVWCYWGAQNFYVDVYWWMWEFVCMFQACDSLWVWWLYIPSHSVISSVSRCDQCGQCLPYSII